MHSGNANKPAIRQAIASLASRPYGWDGADALPVRPDALQLGSCLFGESSDLGLAPLGMPEVTLVEDGTIEVTFRRGGRSLHLGLVSDRAMTFAQSYPDGETTIEGVIRCDRPEDDRRLAEIFAWIGPES